MALRDDEAVKAMMRDLRVLAGCDSLLAALRDRATVKYFLTLVITHAESAADQGRQVLQTLEELDQRGGDR
ncbi:hypothetical protein ACFWWC_10035 [Streptomyces sp. NPDC058642]|uniref:hypothetical protein n=1 Tax=Streptomyces sp. NPDC058642 TaxID=3346572 RepID=UPI00364CD945